MCVRVIPCGGVGMEVCLCVCVCAVWCRHGNVCVVCMFLSVRACVCVWCVCV